MERCKTGTDAQIQHFSVLFKLLFGMWSTFEDYLLSSHNITLVIIGMHSNHPLKKKTRVEFEYRSLRFREF